MPTGLCCERVISDKRSLARRQKDMRATSCLLLLATRHQPFATFFSPATLPLSTLAQSPLATPLQSTHAHLSHSRPPITPAIPTHANLVSPNSCPCNTCEKKCCGRRADIFGVRRLAAAFTVDRAAPCASFERSRLHRRAEHLFALVHQGFRVNFMQELNEKELRRC